MRKSIHLAFIAILALAFCGRSNPVQATTPAETTASGTITIDFNNNILARQHTYDATTGYDFYEMYMEPEEFSIGYDFIFWQIITTPKDDHTNAEYGAAFNPNFTNSKGERYYGNFTVRAIRKLATYETIFDTDGGEELPPLRYTCENYENLVSQEDRIWTGPFPTPVKPGHVFVGWRLIEAPTNKYVTGYIVPQEGLTECLTKATLQAVWEPEIATEFIDEPETKQTTIEPAPAASEPEIVSDPKKSEVSPSDNNIIKVPNSGFQTLSTTSNYNKIIQTLILTFLSIITLLTTFVKLVIIKRK